MEALKDLLGAWFTKFIMMKECMELECGYLKK
jgi:hypothetical protein